MTHWNHDPFALALLALSIVVYAVMVRDRGKPVFFGAAVIVVAIALLSPIAFYAHAVLFSAHMLQHLLLVLIVPPLVLLSLPHEAPTSNAPSASIGRAIPTWGLGVGAMWLWHAPTLCNAASTDITVLRVQTVSLLLMGAAFFWPIFGTRARTRLSTFGALAYLFTACAACTVLGVGITFSPLEVCSVFGHGALPFGFTARSDQEVGGLLMWVPGCIVYAGCIVVMYGRYARGESRDVSHTREEPS